MQLQPAQAGRQELVTLGQPRAEPVTLEEGFRLHLLEVAAAPEPGCRWSPRPGGRVPAAVASLHSAVVTEHLMEMETQGRGPGLRRPA